MPWLRSPSIEQVDTVKQMIPTCEPIIRNGLDRRTQTNDKYLCMSGSNKQLIISAFFATQMDLVVFFDFVKINYQAPCHA
jgi:hypothetical protein